MKKIGIALLSALMLSAAIGGVATVGASAAVEDVPEKLTLSNVASGKDVSFRSLTNMEEVIDWGAYYPDETGFYGKDHGDMLRYADGYMTAWFMYYLKGDEYAGGAFFGDNAEIRTNANWQDTQSSK